MGLLAWCIAKEGLCCALSWWFIQLCTNVLIKHGFCRLWMQLGCWLRRSVWYILLKWRLLFLTWRRIYWCSSKSIHRHPWSCPTSSFRWSSPSNSLCHASLRSSTTLNSKSSEWVCVWLWRFLGLIGSTTTLDLIYELLSIILFEWSIWSLQSEAITDFSHKHFILVTVGIVHASLEYYYL